MECEDVLVLGLSKEVLMCFASWDGSGVVSMFRCLANGRVAHKNPSFRLTDTRTACIKF